MAIHRNASRRFLPALFLAVAGASPACAATVAYTDLTLSPVDAYGELDADSPVFGDALNLSQAGVLNVFGVTLFNPDYESNEGAILTGDMVIRFYDNTTPYTAGALNNPLLGSTTIHFDFSSIGGLPAGFYDEEAYDLSALNIYLPQNIFVTQQFTQTSGDSLYNGATVYDPATVGTSPDYVYIKSAATDEGLYAFNNLPSQFGYSVSVTSNGETPPAAPLPSSVAGILLLTGSLGIFHLRHKRTCA